MKEKDWIVAGLNNPEYNTEDFIFAGLTTENTQLLTPGEYKKSHFIQEKFSKDGKFDEDEFDRYYKQKALEYQQFSVTDKTDLLQYDPFDPRSATARNVKTPVFILEQVANPDRQVTMLSGQVFENPVSKRERAQQSKIFDTGKQEFTNESPDDQSFAKSPLKWVKSLFSDPLVYATYDEDGEHYDQFSGRMVQHQKGEYKLNQFGMPYTETLNGRSLIGKEVVSKLDTITVDGEGINKYDFFDSDDVEKSVGGTIMKAVTAVAPLFTPVAGVYSGLLIGREMLKTLPMLYGMASSLFNVNPENRALNTFSGFAQGFTGGTSDYGKSSMLNFEQVGNLISDVATQWGSQKLIANGIAKARGMNQLQQVAVGKSQAQYMAQRAVLEDRLKKGVLTEDAFLKYVGTTDKWAESAVGKALLNRNMEVIKPMLERSRRLGADASLAYMALISNTDVYESMLEHGASRKEAAAVTLGSTLGMFGVDRYLGLGEVFFDDLGATTSRQVRETLRKEADSWYTRTIKDQAIETAKTSPSKLKRLVNSGMNLGKKATNKFIDDLQNHSLGFVGKAVGEGLEEVSEEVVSDLSKQMYELAGDLGFNTNVKDVGAFDNWLERYAMNFFGGALGGGIFYGVDVYQNGKFSIDRSQDELIYLARNGHTKEALDELQKMRDKGKLGSKDLSIDTVTDENGNKTYVTADENHVSQNDFVYDRMRETIVQLDNIINENKANLNEDQLYENMILSDVRFHDLKDYLQGLSYSTGYQDDYQSAVRDVVNLQQQLNNAVKTVDGTPDVEPATDEQLRHMTPEQKEIKQQNIEKLQGQLDEAKRHLDNFLSGKYSQDYVEKMLFALDNDLNQGFVTMTYDQWLKKNHDGKKADELSEAEATQYKQEYLDYKKIQQKLDLSRQFSIYKDIREKVDPLIREISENQLKYKEVQDAITGLVGQEDSPLFNAPRLYGFDDVLDFNGETEESDSYKNRNNDTENRVRIINERNQQSQEKYRDDILKVIDDSGGYIDPNTRRQLELLLEMRNKELVKSILRGVSDEMAANNTLVDQNTGVVTQVGQLSEQDKRVLDMMESLDFDDPKATWDKMALDIRNEHVKKNQGLLDLQQFLGDMLQTDDFIGLVKSAYVDKGKSIQDLSDYLKEDAEDYGISEEQVNQFISDLDTAYNDNNPDFLEKYVSKPYDEFLSGDNEYNDDIAYYRNVFDGYLKSVNENPLISLNNELDKRVREINPVTDFVRKLALSLNVDNNNLEDILGRFDQRYRQVDDIADFEITPQEEESLDEAAQLIKMAMGYIHAASEEGNLLSPFGHNRAINDFAKNNKDAYPDFNELPMMSPDVASMYLVELQKYLLQIGVTDEKTGNYNPGSWLYLANQNKINKAQQHVKADRAWNKAHYDLFSDWYKQGALKFEKDGVSHDLLEGFEMIPLLTDETENPALINAQISSLLFNNVRKLVDSGWTHTDIFKQVGLFGKVLNTDDVIRQKTSVLDENITKDRLTEYDKMVIFLTNIALDPAQFYSRLKDRVTQENNITPLTIQEWTSRVGQAYVNDHDVFDDALSLLSDKTDKRLVFAAYVNGDAGSGKSSVVGKSIASWVDSNDVWVSAPKIEQANNLFNSVGKGVKMTNRDDVDGSTSLFKRMGINMDAMNAAMRDINGKKDSSGYYSVKSVSGISAIVPDFSKFGIHKIANAPKMVVVDEVTHLSSLELQVLSQWAKVNDTRLVFLGDDKQKGFLGIGRNIDREGILTLRTPSLGISLRDNNAQHQRNLQVLSGMLRQLSDLDTDDENYKADVLKVKQLLPSIKFKVYDGDDINGDLLATGLTEDIVSKMDGTIGYVGDQTGASYEMLNRLKGDRLVPMTEKSVQGQEFDYVVVDKNWKPVTVNSRDVEALDFLQDLYTMISRGRKGSVIIDNGALSTTIGGNTVDNVKAVASNIANYTDQFRRQKLKSIDEILSNLKPAGNTTDDGAGNTEATDDTKGYDDLRTNDDAGQPEEDSSNDDLTAMDEENGELGDIESIDVKEPILGYGNATTTGLRVEMRDNRQVWINPVGLPKRDAMIFLGENEKEIADNDRQIKLSNLLRSFKNNILYNKEYDDLPKDIRDNYVSKNAYDNIEWYIEARPRNDQDNFIRNTGFDDSRMGITDKNLVFSVVGKLKLKDGTDATITLGLLSDPRTFVNQASAITERINKKILRLRSEIADGNLSEKQKGVRQDKIRYYEDYVKKIDVSKPDSVPNKYDTYIKGIAQKYVDKPVLVRIPKIITPGLTDFHKQGKVVRLSRISRGMIQNVDTMIQATRDSIQRLADGSVAKAQQEEKLARLLQKKQEFETIRDQSFRSLNPYTRVSPMYVYAPQSGQNKIDVDDSLIGRCCVVFVTNDASLREDELADVYLRQKAQARKEAEDGNVNLRDTNVTPRVRMMVLNNMGVSFQDMSNPYLAESMRSQTTSVIGGKQVTKTQVYPFKTNYMGVRMYVGLWNFRANLLQFNDKAQEFLRELGERYAISKDQLDEYLKVKDLLYREKNTSISETEKAYLDQRRNLKNLGEISDAVDKFNDGLHNQVKQFRLGSGFANGAYVRQLTGDVSMFYDTSKKTPSGIYVDMTTLGKYVGIAESLFTDVLDHVVTCDYQKDRLMSADKRPDVRNSFANHIKSVATTNGKMEIHDGQTGESVSVNFGSSFDPTNSKGALSTFSHIPAVLSKVFKYTSMRMRHHDDDGNDFGEGGTYRIRITGTTQDENGQEQKLDKEIPYWRLFDQIDMIKNASEYTKEQFDALDFDPTLSNFFSFAFHGTLDDVQGNAQRASDALFPRGFFADPLSTMETVKDASGGTVFKKVQQQQVFFGSDVRVGDPTFFISLNDVKTGLNPAIQSSTQANDQIRALVDDAKRKYPDISSTFDNMLGNVTEADTVDDVKEKILQVTSDFVNANYAKMFARSAAEPPKASTYVKIDPGTDEPITFSRLVREGYGDDSFTFQDSDISKNGDVITITTDDVTLNVTKGLRGGINVEVVARNQESSDIPIDEIKGLLDQVRFPRKQDQVNLVRLLDRYMASDDKENMRKTIVSKLKGIVNQQTDEEMTDKIDELINKIE